MEASWSFMNLKKFFAFLLIFSWFAGLTICERVDGGWGEWECWESECSKSCGGGTRTRRRLCNNPTPSENGTPCEGLAKNIVNCNLEHCPEAGGYGPWLEWFACSKSCGAGSQTRVRQCNDPEPRHGGAFCSDANIERIPCNEGPCPVHGHWGRWSDYGRCSTTCGPGVRRRLRQCYGRKHGGNPCPGKNTTTKSCHERRCPVDGQWSEWIPWSDCSVTCAQGIRTRTRSCDNPPPESGGQKCPGGDRQTKSCTATRRHCPVNGGWTDWMTSARCRGCSGDMIKTRRCTNPRPQYGGATCEGPLNQAIPCRETDACQG